ncbi:MAG: efflux RND transporter permease subunit [Candidatus Brocadiae bacterium]|nr:efflux RND transporter permease subunit [Candidatus Brocadiia bacterium]
MRSVVRWCIDNPVCVNLGLFLIILGGFFYLDQLNRELFPEFSLDRIIVQVVFPGASPEEVEEGICIKIEEAITGISGIKKVDSTARESIGSVLIEIESGEDIYRMKDEIESRINQINTFPKDAEKPIVQDLKLIRQVLFITVSGDMSEETLRGLSEEIKDDLLQLPEISRVSIVGLREYEISIELSEENMRKYNVSAQSIGSAIQRNSLDITGGIIKTDQGEILLRVKGQKYKRKEFEDIIVKTNSDGAHIYLHQIASVKDAFEESKVKGYLNSKRAALINVSKTEDEDSIKISQTVINYIEKKEKTVPKGVHLGIFGDTSKLVQSRLDLLTVNGMQGLILVFVSLTMFLSLKLSIWVTLGIPLSFLGTFILMVFLGQSLNMLSMFALIMCLGIVVDDAIVISESIYSHIYINRLSPKEAAFEGTARVFWPVVASVSTTVVAFLSLLSITGIMGKFMAVIPITVTCILVMSLLEALVSLPCHLSRSLKAEDESTNATAGAKIRKTIEDMVKWVVKSYIKILRLSCEYRYTTVALGIFMLLFCFGLVQGGFIKFILFPKLDSDTLRVQLAYPEGASNQITEKTILYIQEKLEKLHQDMKKEYNREEDIVKKIYTVIGQHSTENGTTTASNLAEISVELQPSEERKISSELIANRWREEVGEIAGIKQAIFGSSREGPGGKPIQVQLRSSSFEDLKQAAFELKTHLRRYPGVFDIQDDFQEGYKELRLSLKPQATNLGLTLSDMASQVRHAFYGNEILRLQRGKFDVKVFVRYPSEERVYLSDLEKVKIRINNQEIPISEVAEGKISNGYSLIKRIEGKRVVNVIADLNEFKANANEINTDLVQSGYLSSLCSKYRGMSYAFEGQRKETEESMQGLKYGFLFSLLAIYMLLATIFASYLQPLIIMMAIPFGLIGALLGHYIMAYPITLMSFFGLVALGGMVVNNSLIIIDFINEALAKGMGMFEAIENAGEKRFRAILLTTLTTIVGITPLMFERSLQAQFLIPMAISLAFGLLFSTLLTLFMVPAAFIILSDFMRLIAWIFTGKWKTYSEIWQRD